MVAADPLSPETPVPPTPDFRRVEDARLLAEGMRVGAAAAIPVVVVLLSISSGIAHPAHLGSWALLAVTLHLAIVTRTHRCVTTPPTPETAPRRIALLTGLAALSGLVWGAGAWLLLPLGGSNHSVVFASLMAGLWIGAGSVLGASATALGGFLVLSALPPALRFANNGSNSDTVWLGMSLAALALILVLGAARIRRGMAESRRLRIEGETRERLLRKQQSRLVESEEKYRLLFERSEDPMWLIVEDHFTLANDAAARFLGFHDADAITNLHPSQLSPPSQPCGTPSDELAERMMATAHRQGYHRFEWVHVTRLGKEIPVEVTLTRVPYEGSWALFCVWRDISDRIRFARELQAARELAERESVAKSTFLATMSHEIRTPLSAVLGMAELLQDTPLDEDQKDYTRSILTAGQSLLAVINDVLDLSKIEAGRLELCPREWDLGLLLRDLEQVFRLRAKERGLDFIVDLREDCPRHVVLDDARLAQILMNLCGNACKFTKEGEIRVTVSSSCNEGGIRRLVLAVSDTGIGIEESVQQTLFTPYRQATGATFRRYGGSGLGLSICSQLAELMDGSIRLESTPGVGSTFTVELPLVLAEEREKKVPTAPEFRARTDLPKSGMILVVDDVTVTRRVATAMLASLGFSHTAASDGAEAVRLYGVMDVDLILMDCQMPVLDGYEATRRIREIERGTGRHVPIIALSAAALVEDRVRCEAAGMDDFLAKPFKRAEMEATLDRWLSVVDTDLPADSNVRTGTHGERPHDEERRRPA